MELVEAMMEPVEVLVELVEAMKEPLEVLWNSWMQRQLHTRRYRRLAVRPRMQRLRKIVVSRTGQEKQHEHVCSSGFSWNRQMRRPLQKEGTAVWQYVSGCKDCGQLLLAEYVKANSTSMSLLQGDRGTAARKNHCKARPRFQRLQTIVVSRIRQSKQNGHVSSSGWSRNNWMRRPLHIRRYCS